TLYNKAPFVVAQRAVAFGVPVIAVVGSLGPGHESVLEHGIEAVEPAATCGMPPEEATARADALVRDAAERAMRGYLARRRA
ncbi:MAG: glycerate kinase, partial [Chloroflexi bacterium]|nr:glycerate kinase [Chloroflexota bacterium]